MHASLSELNFEDAKITVNLKNNEVIITPTESKKFIDEKIHFNAAEEKLKIGNPDFGNVQDVQAGLDEKLTIKGPGSYIKKLIQQFSEVQLEDPKPESDRAISSIKDRADAICKKCLHYKGKITK